MNLKRSHLAVTILFFGIVSFPLPGISAPRSTEVFFSPRDSCGNVILNYIGNARETVEVAMYLITSRQLSQALVDAHERGVKVRIYLDGENANEYYSKADFLKKKGVPVKLEKGEGLMHHKYCIIDGKTIITGSYNWTASADLKNDENVIIMHSRPIARVFRIQFERYWQGHFVDKSSYQNRETLQKRRKH